MSFFDLLKNIFVLLLFLQLAPSLIEGIKKQYSHYITPKTNVGVVTIRGTLCDSNVYNKHLHTFFQDPEIKAILLKIECPGGAAASSQAVHNELLALKKEYPKPVIVLVENVCTSGGYYVASAADHIVAPGSALIGSIGATMPYLFQLKELIENYNVHYVPLKAGTYKTVGDPFVEMTTEEKMLLQAVIDDTYQQFANDIAKNRKLSMTTIASWGDGKIFTALQAKQLGLVDEIGSAYNAIKALKEKALIEGEIEWINPAEETSFWSLLAGGHQDYGDTMFGQVSEKMATLIQDQLASKAFNTIKTGLQLQ